MSSSISGTIGPTEYHFDIFHVVNTMLYREITLYFNCPVSNKNPQVECPSLPFPSFLYTKIHPHSPQRESWYFDLLLAASLLNYVNATCSFIIAASCSTATSGYHSQVELNSTFCDLQL